MVNVNGVRLAVYCSTGPAYPRSEEITYVWILTDVSPSYEAMRTSKPTCVLTRQEMLVFYRLADG
jgi:hypothetical protein